MKEPRAVDGQLRPAPGSPATEVEPRLGDRLKAGRLRRRLTIKSLGEDPDIGVSATFLSRVERNDAVPSEELLIKLSRTLGLDPSEMLLHLYRERATPEVREHVPRPAHLKLEEGLRGRRFGSLDGVESIAGPLSELVESFRRSADDNRELREENQGLYDEVARLRGELLERKRDVLPEVNKFLVSLFHYESELVRRETFMEPNGDCTVSYTLEGIRPRRGMKPVRGLTHGIFIPMPVAGLRALEEEVVDFKILEKPEGLRVEHGFTQETGERASLNVLFPDGFEWTPQQRPLSYSFSYRLQDVFAMTLEEAAVRYGKASVHPEIYEWSSCFINKPVRTLEVALVFPEGYAPRYVDKWVWWMEMSFLAADYNLGDKLLLEEDEGIAIEKGRQTRVLLRAKNPLLGFNYGIVWEPLAKLDLPRSPRG